LTFAHSYVYNIINARSYVPKIILEVIGKWKRTNKKARNVVTAAILRGTIPKAYGVTIKRNRDFARNTIKS